MRRDYPYLHDKYFTNTDTEDKVSRSILKDIEEFVNQRQYIRLTLLDWKENPIREIQGEVTSGSLSKVAQSPVRRSGNLSIAIDAGSYNVDNAKADFAINKKIYIELGVRNDTNKYPDYPIFWFPEGVFFIGSFSIASSSGSTTNINLTLKDKMAMLNGEIGGKFPALIHFDTEETQLPDGSEKLQKVLIYRIIQELVNHYGKEPLVNIVIEDVPLRIRRVLQWTGDKPLYLVYKTVEPDSEDEGDPTLLEGFKPIYSLEKPEDETVGYQTFYPGDDIGYRRDNFVVVDDLIANAGETITSVLDKLVTLLGNYEYFYDVFGIFHFREVKNYINQTLGKKALTELAEKDYLVDTTKSKNIFCFSDETLLSSITVTPLYENIKNDFIIDGLYKNETTGVDRSIRYHLAIDKKPEPIGIDKRRYIKKIKDRTEDIEKIKEIILKEEQEQAAAKEQRDRISSDIDSYNLRVEQRYDSLIYYGDDIKQRLMTVLGEFAVPANQKIPDEFDFRKSDFYPNKIDEIRKEEKRQKGITVEIMQRALNPNDEKMGKKLEKYNDDEAREKTKIKLRKECFESFFDALKKDERPNLAKNWVVEEVKEDNKSKTKITWTIDDSTSKSWTVNIDSKVSFNPGDTDIDEDPIEDKIEDFSNSLFSLENGGLFEENGPLEVYRDNEEQRTDIKATYKEFFENLYEQYLENSSTVHLKEFNQTVFSYLKPEGYWRLLCASTWSGKIWVENTLKNYGILQNAYLSKEREAWVKQLKAWEEAKSLIMKKNTSYEDFDSVPSDGTYKNPETGATKISEEQIVLTDGTSVYRPVDKIYTNLTRACELRSMQSPKSWLRKIFNKQYSELEEEEKNEKQQMMKLIYSEYNTSLTPTESMNERTQLKQQRAQIKKLKLDTKSQVNALTRLLKKYTRQTELTTEGFLQEKPTSKLITETYYTYTLSKNLDNPTVISKKALGTFTSKMNINQLNKKLSIFEKKYNNYEKQEKELTKQIETLDLKISNESLEGIYTYIYVVWEPYEKELKRIKELKKKITTLEKQLNTEVYIEYPLTEDRKTNTVQNIIANFGLEKSIYTGLLVEDKKIPLILNETDTPSVEDWITKRQFYDESIKDENNDGYKNVSLYNGKTPTWKLDKVYTYIIEGLNALIKQWEQNPNYVRVDNPHYKDTVYWIFTDRPMVLYKEPTTSVIKAGFVDTVSERPKVGNFNLIYPGESGDTEDLGYYYWDGTSYKALEIKGVYSCNEGSAIDILNGIYDTENENDLNKVGSAYFIYDWRTFLYLQGMYAKIMGTDKGHYFEELEAFWPQTYDLLNQYFYSEGEDGHAASKWTSGIYFLDFLDSVGTSFGEWSVDNIGRRTDIVHNEKINCLFEPEIPNINILNATTTLLVEDGVYALEDEWSLKRLRQEAEDEGEPYIQLDDDYYDNIITGGRRNSAYEQIKYELYLHTRYQKSISMSSIPVFYLEPNSRITIADTATNTFGDFVIQSIGLTFGPGANMSISANEVFERF